MKIVKNLHGFVGLLCCTLLFSCNKEEWPAGFRPEDGGNHIHFGVVSPLHVQTKAAAHPQAVKEQRFVLRSREGSETLSVHARVSEGIEVSAFKGPQVLTRAAPVTQADFYDSFHVLAYWKENGTLASGFYMDEDATDLGTVWGPDQAHYWLDASHSFQFYAWAPIDAAGLTTPATPQSKDLVYTLPADATQQKDLVVAASAELPGNANATVPLTFNHICTAVRFETGSQMQAGTIKSVALKGVKNAGTYNMATGAWTLGATTADFTQVLNMATTGTEAQGADITPAAGTFMMLPQTLAAGAEMEVVFTSPSHVDRTLTASLENVTWAMGTTVTYRLSITPQYVLDFVSEPQVQDAHYVVYPITIRNEGNLPSGTWTLTSSDPAHVTFVESGVGSGKFAHADIQALVDTGYWLDDNKGTNTLTSNTVGDDIKVYVFLAENATQNDRNLTLYLRPTGTPSSEAQEFSFTQYCPAWNNGLGVERIQDGDYPWGFSWDSDMKVVYSMPGGFLTGVIQILFAIFGDQEYVEQSGSGFFGTWKVTVDFSKVPALNTATNLDDGRTNTWQLYNFAGISEAETIMNQLESWGGTPDRELPTNPTEFAARACAMKNKYRVETENSGGNTVYLPVLDQVNMLWYLPAQTQAPYMNDNLAGNYWTSTAITNPGTTAYKFTAGGTTSPEDRNSVLHVRAVRSMN